MGRCGFFLSANGVWLAWGIPIDLGFSSKLSYQPPVKRVAGEWHMDAIFIEQRVAC